MKGIKPYIKYKPSDIAWLGDIPEHWEVNKLKSIGKLYSGLTGKSGEDFKSENDSNNKKYIPFTNIANNFIINPIKLDTVIIQNNEKQNLVKKDDLLFLMSSENFADIGKTAILKKDIGEVYLNSFCKGYRIKNENFNANFLNYLLACDVNRKQLIIEARGFTRINLKMQKVNNLTFFAPNNKSEQSAIANFLDYKTTKIDRFIRKKKQLIKLLNEQKAGIINDAVTKGLNPNSKTKPSGIEWLGDIPEHWEVRKLKYLVSLNDETLNEKTNPEYELRYIDIGNVNESGGIAEIVNYKFKDAPSRAKRIVKEGDVIISTVRTYLKAITLISSDCKNLIVSTGFAVLRPTFIIDSSFLNFVVRSNYLIQKICAESFGVSYPAINSSELVVFNIAFPKINEQTAIVSHIEKETAIINKTIATIEKEITLVQEYRTAIIAEAVTGKIDVREYEFATVEEETYEELKEELNIAAEDEAEYNNQEAE